MHQLRTPSLPAGCKDRPDPQYVYSSVGVPIVIRSASGARPRPDAQRQTLRDVPARAT
jgi:hypothetical protein